VSRPDTLAWFAGHEFRLGWRDWVALMTAGRRSRARTVAVALILFAAFMHVFAYWIVARYADADLASDTATLVGITGTLVLSWSLLLSQAMESVTRAFYARSDLDLILSSPVSARKVFAVRMGRIAGAAVMIAVLLAAPFINVLAFEGGMHWFGAYAVILAMGATATAIAVALTVALFRTIGAKRTRFVAQIVAAVIGAAFVIGLQIGAIQYYGTLSRFALLESDTMVALAPGIDSIVWWPARAMLGDGLALAATISVGLLALATSIAAFSPRFADHAIAASGVSVGVTRQVRWSQRFRKLSPRRALRAKEFTLLRRDPWLLSQSLMQMLYLLPPALMLWHSFGEGSGPLVLMVPILVMASGQLSGGLAWLAISGEDAPDLVATAPVAAGEIIRAKVEAVMTCIAVVFVPFVLAIALTSMICAVVAAAGIVIAAASATQIQLWFRAQARRSQFRRRHTASRIATFAEAFSSITWAATAALAAAGSSVAVVTGLAGLGILAGTRLLRPPGR